MVFIVHVFFESPLWLGLFSFLIFAAVLFSRLRLESLAARRYALPGVLLLIMVLFGVQACVTTQREQILDALDSFVAAIEREILSGGANWVSDSFQSESTDRERFLTDLKAFLEVWDIRDVRYQRREITLDGSTAHLVLSATATASLRGAIGQRHWGVWWMDWRVENQVWRITTIQPRMIDGMPIHSLASIRRVVP